MKDKLEKVEKFLKLPITVEEEYQFNNQMFQISEIRDNYCSEESQIVEEIIINDDNIDEETPPEETIIKYELFNLVPENKILSKNTFIEGDQIRTKFINTNELEDIKIKINNNVYNLRNIFNEEKFILNSIPVDSFVILEYIKEIIEEEQTIIVDKDDGMGGTIPVEETETITKEIFYFRIKYIENLKSNLLESNYNMYYNTIISSIKDFEKKYSRNVLDCDYKYYIDSISDGDIILPMVDIRKIDKVCYLTLQEKKEEIIDDNIQTEEENNQDIQDNENIENNEDNQETTEPEYEIVEKEIDPSYFTVLKVGNYNEQRIVQISSDFEVPEDILNDGSIESEMPYIFYFSVGYENNIFPEDLKLAFMNDVQFKMMNRGSDILTIANKTSNTTDLVKNIFKNYKYMQI